MLTSSPLCLCSCFHFLFLCVIMCVCVCVCHSKESVTYWCHYLPHHCYNNLSKKIFFVFLLVLTKEASKLKKKKKSQKEIKIGTTALLSQQYIDTFMYGGTQREQIDMHAYLETYSSICISAEKFSTLVLFSIPFRFKSTAVSQLRFQYFLIIIYCYSNRHDTNTH